MMKIYVENGKKYLMENGYYGDTPLQVEDYCKKNGLHFEQDDMGDVYVYESAWCDTFEEYEDL